MYYCEADSTWAEVEDLYSRYGEEYVDKLATRRNWDVDLDQYVADESDEARLRVIILALCDAKQLMKHKLSCVYGNVTLLDEYVFYAVKQWHIKMTIETLKAGGDCQACACIADFDSFVKCGSICTDDGKCLSKTATFVTVSESHFHCECLGSCGCC